MSIEYLVIDLKYHSALHYHLLTAEECSMLTSTVLMFLKALFVKEGNMFEFTILVSPTFSNALGLKFDNISTKR